MGNQGSDGMSPIKVQGYLKGVDYPASRDDLHRKAQENNAPQDVLDAIARLSEDRYGSPTEVTRAISDEHDH